jgi:hypothetical protein
MLTMLSKTLTMSQTELPLLSSSFGHVTHDDDMNKPALPNHVVPDLPSWTPLRTLEDDEGSSASDPGVDELATRKATESSMKRLAKPLTNAQAPVENTVTVGRTLEILPDAKPSERKKARFDGVLIATQRSLYRKHGSQSRPGSASASSLVDALARTFDANRHTEHPFPRQSRIASRQHDDASMGPQTDVETTEAEDERLQLNTRLARTPLKRRRAPAGTIRVSANASETNSEDAAPLLQGIPQPERPVKRLKPFQYESNSALIDAALGTVQAPICWDAEMDFITRDDDFVNPAQTVHVASADARMSVDSGDLAGSSPGKGSVPPSAQTPVRNEWRMPTWGGPKRAILSPYLSRGTKFRQRLDAIFGENVTVRTDRIARPRPVSTRFAHQITLC